MKAQLWVVNNVPRGSVIESSGTCPHWSKLPNFDASEINLARPDTTNPPARDITELRLPLMPGRVELFRKTFPEWVQPLVAEKEGNPDQGLFNAAAWRNAIRITSPFIRRIIKCPPKRCADITVTFLAENSPTPSFSMPTHRVR